MHKNNQFSQHRINRSINQRDHEDKQTNQNRVNKNRRNGGKRTIHEGRRNSHFDHRNDSADDNKAVEEGPAEEEEAAPMENIHRRNNLDILDVAAEAAADGRDIQAAADGTLWKRRKK